MPTVEVSTPAGGRAVFRGRPGGEVLRSTAVPGSVELPTISADHYWQVTLRDGTGLWSENFAIAHPGPGTHQLESLDRLPEHEAGAGGFILGERVTALETQQAQLAGEWAEGSQRLDAHEEALWMVESIVDAHALGEITWMTSGTTRDVQVQGYTPQPVARSYRLEADLVSDALRLATDGRIWLRVMSGSTVLVDTGNILMVNRGGDTHRYRISLDFNAPANAALAVRFAAHGGVQGGRLGITRPVLSTAVERSA